MAIQRGFKIRTSTTPRKDSPGPLYDLSSGFWDNFEKGPRPLTDVEQGELEGLRARVAELEARGASTAVTLAGKEVESPFGVASGPAPNHVWLGFFARLGYSILSFKTVRDRQWTGHGLPNVVHVKGDFEKGFSASDEETGSLTNSLGMPTPEPDTWAEEAKKVAGEKEGKLFVMSVTATVLGETGPEEVAGQFAALASKVKSLGADAVELNLSCPNVLPGEGGETFTDPVLSGRIVGAVRSAVGTGYPILAKVGYLKDYSKLVEKTWDEGVSYVAINSVAAPVADPAGKPLFADRGGKAGICGGAIRKLALEAVRSLASLRRESRTFHVFGVGGVLVPEDAVALMDAGADGVESAAGALLDPCLAMSVRLALLERGGAKK